MTRPTVLLFDIDGTLLASGGAGYRAMLGAFRALHARDDVFHGTSFAGMTDRAIARHGLGALATRATIDESAIDQILEAYLGHLATELASTTFKVLPGVLALLEKLHGRAGVAIGLGTGNIRHGAQLKLARGALDGAFAFGGFGCDAEDRTELLRIGAARGASQLGARVEDCRVVVIGDTPRDVAAAQGIGAFCVGVGTGTFEAAALHACGADLAVATLEDDRVHAALFAP